MSEIKIFLFVLSIIYSLRYVFEFVMKFTTDNVEPIKISKIESYLLLFSISYIITYFFI
jgi:hypothetical protein